MMRFLPCMLFFIFSAHAAEHTKGEFLDVVAQNEFSQSNIELALSYTDELARLAVSSDPNDKRLYADLRDAVLADKILGYIDNSKENKMRSGDSEDFSKFLKTRHQFYKDVSRLVPGVSREEFHPTSVRGPERKVVRCDQAAMTLLSPFFIKLQKDLTSTVHADFREGAITIYSTLHVSEEKIDLALEKSGNDHSFATEYIHFTELFLSNKCKSYKIPGGTIFVRNEDDNDKNAGVREMQFSENNEMVRLDRFTNSLSNLVVVDSVNH